MEKVAGHRPRNAAATRAAILKSARALFARSGYDGVGVREIAENAGVTAMLVNRYFGSKEQLFAEVVADLMGSPSVLTEEATAAGRSPADLAQDIARALVAETRPGAMQLDGFLIMLRSASNARAAEIWRDQTENYHQKQVRNALAGEHAAQRAALILSLIAGFQLMRQVIGMLALADVEPEVLERQLARVFTVLASDEDAP